MLAEEVVKNYGGESIPLRSNTKKVQIKLRSKLLRNKTLAYRARKNIVNIRLTAKDWNIFMSALTTKRSTPKLNDAFKKLKKQCN